MGIDQFLSKPVSVNINPTVIRPSTITYKAGFMYGIQGSYLLNRLLINASLLTTKRVYDVTGQYRLGVGSSSILLPALVEVKARYYSFPITVSYLVKTVSNIGCNHNNIQLFVGAGIVPEWISGSFARESYDVYGSGNVLILDPEKPIKSSLLGSCMQVTGRYNLSQRLVLQAQPSLYYFRTISTPFASTNNSSFRMLASVSYRLN